VAKNGRRPLGMVIDYLPGGAGDPVTPARAIGTVGVPAVAGRSQLALVGAGAFARAVLLPALARLDAPLMRVATSHGLTALDAQKKFGFRAVGTDPQEVFADPEVDAVIIATRHDAHADLAARALAAGKHVFVEK